jgi:hypothetical protein
MKRMTVWLTGFLLAASLAQAGELRLGRAAVRITPPVGMPMGGYFALRLATGTHDDLFANALVLEKDGVKVAIVACDLESIPRKTNDAARELIQKTTGLGGENVMISTTHAHTGPEMSHLFLAWAEGQTAEIAREYHAALPAKIAEAVRRAEQSLTPARAWTATGHENSLSFNRRFLMKDGTARFNPGKLSPDIVRALGPIDPAVPVVYFDSPDAKPLATYVNFALHLDTVGGTQFSADYPYTLAKLLAAAKGPDMLTLFTIGTAGNINHFDVKSSASQQGHEEAARIGTVLAGEVLRTFWKLKPVPAGSIQVRKEIVKLPLYELRPGEIEKARAVYERVRKKGPEAAEFLETVQAFKVLAVSEYQGKPLEAEVQVITLGDQIAWVALPGEVFVELGVALKNASPFPQTIVAELAHDMIDYISNRKAYAEGAYEAVNSRVQSGSGEMLVDAATRLLIDAYAKLYPRQPTLR